MIHFFCNKKQKMANRRIIDMKILTVIRLHEEGTSLRQISTLTGVHRRIVTEYIEVYKRSNLSLSQLSDNDDQSLLDLLGIKPVLRPSSDRQLILEKFLEGQQENRKKPGFSVQNLYEDYKSATLQKAQYSRAQFYKQVGLIWLENKGSLKLDHPFGKQMYVDYTGKKLSFVDKETGDEVSVEVLVAILPASQYIYVEAMTSQKQEDFINGLINALEYFNGVPQAIVTDNLKSSVVKTGKYESTINKTLQGMAYYYQTTIDPTRPYKPKDKAYVEGAVKIVYNQIFYRVSKLIYFSLSQLNEAIKKELIVLNNKLLTHCDYSRRDQFQKELEYLSPLPKYRYEIKTYQKAKVQKMGYVFCSAFKSYYSVPYRFIGKQVEIRQDTRNIEIYYQSERIAFHNINQLKGSYTTNFEHLSSNNQVVLEWNPDFFSQKASKYGIDIQKYIDGLISQKPYPELAYRQALGIIGLCKKYKPHRVNVACRMGANHAKYSYKMIEQILSNGADRAFEEQENRLKQEDAIIPNHENIRGSEYYT